MPSSSGDGIAPLLVVAGLGKRHGEVEAVCDVSLQVAAGEIVGLLGANGAGKTTLIECVVGLVRPDAGTVVVDGVDALADARGARGRMGVMLQAAGLPARLTVREVLVLFAALRGVDEDVAALIRLVGLEAKAGAVVEALSGGQRQRLALAVALLGRPPLLVLDEPSSGFDAEMRGALRGILAGLRAGGHGVLLVTHDGDEAAALCDRVVMLAGGRVV